MASQNTTSFNGVLYRSMAGKVSTGRARGVRLVLKRTGVSGTACCFINSRAHPSTLAYAYNKGGSLSLSTPLNHSAAGAQELALVPVLTLAILSFVAASS
jgi:hypothetical protein